MKQYLSLIFCLFSFSVTLSAQTLTTGFKSGSNGNPISPVVFCADPTALEYNGRLYVYGTNDHQEFLANGKKGDNSYGNIRSIVIFSTADMVNWTLHGTIDTQKICSSWVKNPWYQSYGVSWAPSVTWRTNPETGEDEFFLYFCNSSHGVGVLKASSPVGPFKSPLNKLMIHYDTPGANKQGTYANFDPGVMIDDNGVGWISFGGLGVNGINAKAARIIKLKPSMTEVDGSAVEIPAPYHFEANELNMIGGKYVYTYCSNWANRDNAEWNAYKIEHGITASAPGGGTMCYMVSDNPMDPNSWVYKGAYGPGVNGNNHSHLQKFKGNYYHIYHNHGSVLLDVMKKEGAVDASAGDYRSICVNKANVSESSATVSTVTLDLEGCDAIDTVNPYELQQAETFATCGGLEYEDFTNIKKNGRISTLGNDASENLQVKMDAGDWTYVRKVDFGTKAASRFMIRAKGTGTFMISVGRKGAKSVVFDFSSTDMEDHVVEVDPEKFKGTKNLYFSLTSATGDVYWDAWQFMETDADGIQTLESDKPLKRQFYDLSGRPLSSASQAHGIIIEQTVDARGVKHQRKTMYQ